MYLAFGNGRLESASLKVADAVRFFGPIIGRRYIQRMAILRATESFDQLYGLRALRLHQLRGDRAGQYAISLNGNFRMILERIDDDGIRILGVEDYHGN